MPKDEGVRRIDLPIRRRISPILLSYLTEQFAALAALIADAGGDGLYNAYVCVRDVKEQNIDGGGFTSGAWQTRDINDEQADAAGICSINGNQITLAAGTYRCHIACPVYNVNRHQARLYNVTGSTILLLGTSQYSWAGASTGIRAFIVGRFTVAAGQALEIQHRCETTCAFDGFGSHAGYFDEVYTIAEFWRET